MTKNDIIDILANTLAVHVFSAAYATKEEIDENTSIIYLHEFDEPIRPINIEEVEYYVNYYLSNQCKSIIDTIDGVTRI